MWVSGGQGVSVSAHGGGAGGRGWLGLGGRIATEMLDESGRRVGGCRGLGRSWPEGHVGWRCLNWEQPAPALALWQRAAACSIDADRTLALPHVTSCPAGAWQSERLAAVLFPTADTLPALQRIDDALSGSRLTLIVNPQWHSEGQVRGAGALL